MNRWFVIATFLLGLFFIIQPKDIQAQEWSQPTNVSQNSNRSLWASVTATSDNQTQIVFWDPIGWIQYTSGTSGSWSPLQTIGYGGDPSMISDSNDNLHAVWGQTNPCTGSIAIQQN